jgi:hypothetical protein
MLCFIHQLLVVPPIALQPILSENHDSSEDIYDLPQSHLHQSHIQHLQEGADGLH